MLSGHGCFGEYLCNKAKEPTTECHSCGERENNAEHTIEICPAWARQRGALLEALRKEEEFPWDPGGGPSLDINLAEGTEGADLEIGRRAALPGDNLLEGPSNQEEELDEREGPRRNEDTRMLSLPELVKAMIGDKKIWNAVASFCEEVISQKETEERNQELDPDANSIRKRRRGGLRRRLYNRLFL